MSDDPDNLDYLGGAGKALGVKPDPPAPNNDRSPLAKMNILFFGALGRFLAKVRLRTPLNESRSKMVQKLDL